jgi:hypothetical protein
VRDEKGECARIVYGILPGDEPGCIYEKLVIVGPDVTEDAVKIIANKEGKYTNQFLFKSCPGSIVPDEVRLCYGKIAEMYARATTLAPAIEAVTEQKAPEQPAEPAPSAMEPPVLEQRVIAVNGSEARPDAEFEEITEDDLLAEEARAAPAGKGALEKLVAEVVCTGITRIRLADIERATRPNSQERYSYITTETAMMTTFAAAFDDLVKIEYDKAVMLSGEVAFDFGSREMLRPYEEKTTRPITKEQQKALVERLKAALPNTPQEQLKQKAKAMLPKCDLYTALAEFFGDNKEEISFYQLDNPSISAVLGRVIPEKGTVAVYCYDEQLMKQLIDGILRQRKSTKFSEAVDRENYVLKVNGWRVHFVGAATKQIFTDYVAEIEEISGLGDLISGSLDESNKRRQF